jgi:molybdate/tungstate transport system substrate-binding protein
MASSNPSSPPSPSGAPAPTHVPMGTSTSVWAVVVIIVAAAVGGVGFYAGYEYRGSPAANPSAVQNSTLSILGAGTLNTIFPSLADALVNETPGISAPAAAQTYEGSLDITTAIAQTGAKADVAAVADFRLIPSLLEPHNASYEIVWGSTPEVLVYNASLPAFAGVNSWNWASDLVNSTQGGSAKPFGAWNASTDPNGYNEIFSLMLQGSLFGSGAAQYYSQLYNGAPGSYASPIPKVTVLEHESQAATLINTGIVGAVITYRSFAVVNHLSYVPLNPIVGLYANNTTALNDYAKLTTQIISSSGGTTTVVPAPILFSITVPSNAPNPALGAAFIHLLLSPEGAAIISAGGAFTPIFPGWTDKPSALPSVLAPDVTSLPSWASAFLT